MHSELNISEYAELSSEKKTEIINKIIANDEIEKVFKAASKSHVNSALNLIIDLSKKLHEKMKAYTRDIIELLYSDNPKIRTKTLQIIREIDPAYFIDDLIKAIPHRT